MSGTYWLQSRIASGSQAARCCGVHCCALAGKDAHVSATPRSARAVTGRTFNAARIPTLVLRWCVLPQYYCQFDRRGNSSGHPDRSGTQNAIDWAVEAEQTLTRENEPGSDRRAVLTGNLIQLASR